MKTLNSIKQWARVCGVQFVLVSVALIFVSGCASNSYKKSDAAAESLRKAAMAVNMESRTIDVTLAAMDDLVNKPAADLKPQFDRYSDALDRLMNASDRAEKASDRASKRSAEYFQSWDKDLATINYEAVRTQGESRKAEVTGQFNTVNGRYQENQNVVRPLIVYFQDIRTSLGADLTPGGLQAVRPLAENAAQNARKVQTALAHLAEDLSASGMRMSSVYPQTPSAPQGGVSDTTETSQQVESGAK